MAQIRERDVSAFEQLYDAYHRLVYGVALRMLGDRSSAEDLTQAVFLKVWHAPESFRAGNFGAWLARVARNKSLDVLRRRSAHAETEFGGDIALDESLDEVVFSRLEGAQVRAALAHLPPEQRSLIEAGFFEGVTHEELARRTSTPLGTVKTRIRAGLRKMRAYLTPQVTT